MAWRCLYSQSAILNQRELFGSIYLFTTFIGINEHFGNSSDFQKFVELGQEKDQHDQSTCDTDY